MKVVISESFQQNILPFKIHWHRTILSVCNVKHNRFSYLTQCQSSLTFSLILDLAYFCIQPFICYHCQSELSCINKDHYTTKCPCFRMEQYCNKQCPYRCDNLDRVCCVTQKTFCQCGSNKKVEDITSSCNMRYLKRAIEFPYFKSMWSCSTDCQCRNTYGKKSEKGKVTL